MPCCPCCHLASNLCGYPHANGVSALPYWTPAGRCLLLLRTRCCEWRRTGVPGTRCPVRPLGTLAAPFCPFNVEPRLVGRLARPQRDAVLHYRLNLTPASVKSKDDVHVSHQPDATVKQGVTTRGGSAPQVFPLWDGSKMTYGCTMGASCWIVTAVASGCGGRCGHAVRSQRCTFSRVGNTRHSMQQMKALLMPPRCGQSLTMHVAGAAR